MPETCITTKSDAQIIESIIMPNHVLSLNISKGKIFVDFVDFLRPAKILSSKYLVDIIYMQNV